MFTSTNIALASAVISFVSVGYQFYKDRKTKPNIKIRPLDLYDSLVLDKLSGNRSEMGFAYRMDDPHKTPLQSVHDEKTNIFVCQLSIANLSPTPITIANVNETNVGMIYVENMDVHLRDKFSLNGGEGKYHQELLQKCTFPLKLDSYGVVNCRIMFFDFNGKGDRSAILNLVFETPTKNFSYCVSNLVPYEEVFKKNTEAVKR